MLDVSEQQLRSWQRQGLIPDQPTFSFSDLIALKTLQKLRENRIPAQRIGRALVALKKQLSGVRQPLSELKIVSDGRSITVQIAGQKIEPITGQMLFDFDTAEIGQVTSFPDAKPRIDERQAEMWFQRGLELEETGAPPVESIEAYKRAIELNPNAAGALVNLGTLYYHLHKLQEAEEYYQKAIKVDPKYPLAHFNLGNLCDELGQFGEALQHYSNALKLNPVYADAHYNLALLHEQTGDLLKATRHWKAYLKLDSSSSWASIARRQLEKLREATVVERGRGSDHS